MADIFADFTSETLKSPTGVQELNRILNFLVNAVAGDGINQRVFSGYGSPEGSVVADVGSLYLRKDGGAGTSLYVKQSGTGATGWTGK